MSLIQTMFVYTCIHNYVLHKWRYIENNRLLFWMSKVYLARHRNLLGESLTKPIILFSVSPNQNKFHYV